MLSVEPLGCCSRYKECSDEKVAFIPTQCLPRAVCIGRIWIRGEYSTAKRLSEVEEDVETHPPLAQSDRSFLRMDKNPV